MRTLVIIFGNGNHQNRKVASDAAKLLREAGHEISVRAAHSDPPPDPVDYDAAILVSSLHNGHYEGPILRFARENFVALNTMPSAFVSVSRMSGNGRSDDVERRLWEAVERLRRTTFWHPPVVHHTPESRGLNGHGLVGRIVNGLAMRIGMISAAEHAMRELSRQLALTRFLEDFVASLRDTLLSRMARPSGFATTASAPRATSSRQ